MKTLVMTTIFVVTVVINAFGGNIQENFAYNEVMNIRWSPKLYIK